MKNIDKILENAKNQNIGECPFSDKEIRNFVLGAEIPQINHSPKIKGLKTMSITGLILSVFTGVFLLTTDNSPDTAKHNAAKQAAKAKVTQATQNSNNNSNKFAASDAGNDDLPRQFADNTKSTASKADNKIDENVVLYLCDTSKADAYVDFVIPNEEEMKKFHIYKTDCGFTILTLQEYSLYNEALNNRDEIKNAGYPPTGNCLKFITNNKGYLVDADVVKYENWDMKSSKGIYPYYIGVYQHKVIERYECNRYCKTGMDLNILEQNTIIEVGQYQRFNEKLHDYFFPNDSDTKKLKEVKSIRAYYSSKKTPQYKYYIPVLVKVENKGNYTGYGIILYPTTTNFKNLLPEKYKNIKVYDDGFTKLDKNSDISKISNAVNSTVASSANLCPDIKFMKPFDTTPNPDLAGLKYLTLDKRTLEKLGVYITDSTIVNTYDQKIDIDKKVMTEERLKNLATHNYDTSAAKISFIERKNLYNHIPKVPPADSVLKYYRQYINETRDAFNTQIYWKADTNKLKSLYPNFTFIRDTSKLQLIIPEMLELLNSDSYKLDTTGYIFNLLENTVGGWAPSPTKIKFYELLDKHNLDKYVLAKDKGLIYGFVIITPLNDISNGFFTIVDGYHNDKEISKRFEGLEVSLSFKDEKYFLHSYPKNIIPIEYKYYEKNRMGGLTEIKYVFVYYVDYDFTSKLPDKYRIPLEKELELMGKVTRGEIREDEACDLLEGKESFLGLCDEVKSIIQNVKLYPNPTNSKSTALEFNLDEQSVISVNIFGGAGNFSKKLVYDKIFDKGNQKIEINLEGIPKGMYEIVIIDKNNRKIVRKLIVN